MAIGPAPENSISEVTLPTGLPSFIRTQMNGRVFEMTGFPIARDKFFTSGFPRRAHRSAFASLFDKHLVINRLQSNLSYYQ